jgi:adenylate cyclase
MTDIFISYARSTEAQARKIAEALRELGYGVWRDDELPAHRAYSEVIEERLRAAKAVVVVWSADAVKSQWVRAEAEVARDARTLVQLSVDGAVPPLPFNQFQCADMAGWCGDLNLPNWRKVVSSVADLTGGPSGNPASGLAPAPSRQQAICVLPFANMSGEAEQEYFSDGISEDIITDLTKVSALSVVARNTAFTFKGKAVDVRQVARQLEVSHVLEGSVRKAGNRVRITAQLIDGASGDHTWAERWDRDLTDIFALQDEISEAVVAALKVRLLPEEKEAIERRGTASAEAYDLYLMARQHLATGNRDFREADATLRLCHRATEIDPEYARAWALMAWAQTSLHFADGRPEDGLAAAERALELDPDLAEAHAIRARHLFRRARHQEALGEIDLALRLDPDSYEVNQSAGLLSLRQHRFEDAIRYYEKATALSDTAFSDPSMLISGYTAVGDPIGVRRAARQTLARVEKALAQDRSNGSAMAFGVIALAALGETQRANDWIRRALLIDPDNMNMRYNLACSLSAWLKDTDAALDLLGPYFKTARANDLIFARTDPDLDPIRADPRFQAMVAAAEARLAAPDEPGSSAGVRQVEKGRL